MEIFVCGNVFVPLRSGPSHRSEMLSQVLFGEKYNIIETIGHWYKIKTLFDNYTGWIDFDHLEQYECSNGSAGFVLNKSLLCFREDNSKLVLEAGCEIYEPDYDRNMFTAGNVTFKTGSEFNPEFLTVSESVTDTAMRFINSPYIWGGRIPSGIDCSGFVQLAYKIHKVNIPRDSYQQARTGYDVSFIDDCIPGDLVFFDDDRGKITHVGMILARGLVIHSSGRVRIDRIDHQGIYKNEIRGYSHKLRMIRRIIPA